MNTGLKPCPFCGYSGGVVIEASRIEYGGYRGYYGFCPECMSRGPTKFQSYNSTEFTRKEAADAWNRRTNDE